MVWLTVLNCSTGVSKAKSSSIFPQRIPVVATHVAISLIAISPALPLLATIGETLPALDFGTILAFERRVVCVGPP